MAEPTSKRRKLKSADRGKSNKSNTITDPRFAGIQSDPRYQLPSKRHTHVKLDKRFSRILKDEDFGRKSKVDRYGRPLEADAEQQRLKRRYEFDEDDVDDDAEVQTELRAAEKTHDPLREGKAEASSSEEESSDEDSEVEEDAEKRIGAHQEDDVPMGDVTSRIAVVNLDWDNIRAEDLMAVFSSFLPATGRLVKVTIYPSEFGKERMEREEMEGPPKDIFTASKPADEVSDSDWSGDGEDDEEDIKATILKPDDGSEFDSAALRRYQLDRLRYYYAVLTFSSPTAAKAIYDACDGTEYLSTANFFDLRFVPDDTDFSTDKVREECEKIPDGYKPNEFVTDALQHSKVRLTWDAEDGGRKEAQARAFRGGASRREIDENDLKAYLGSDSEDDVEVEGIDEYGQAEAAERAVSKKDQERQRMRALLGLEAEPVKKSKKENGPVGDLQITFSSGLSGSKGAKTSVFENEPEIEETTVEKYVRKERERKQKRKERSKTGRDGETAPAGEDEDASTAIAADGDAEEEDLGFDDPFFAEPNNDTKTSSKIRKADRLKKRAEREREEAASKAQRAELELLMVDDKEQDVRHFDMAEIERAEKQKRKKGKKNKKKAGEAAGEEAAEEEPGNGFKMDTQDPRFARLYENHEFAIDPTNPKFRGTEGMKALLDEGRRRGKGKEGKDAVVEDRESARRTAVGEPDVKQLVEKMKRKKEKMKQ